MSVTETINSLLEKRILVIDGAMGTQIQDLDVPKEAWIDHSGKEQEGCNELLNDTAADLIKRIHKRYAMAGADLIKTNTFGTMPWVLDEYQMGERAYELSKKGAELVKEICVEYGTEVSPKFVLGSIGPGTKLPSLGHIHYDEMYEGYKKVALGLIDGGCDVFLLETCQDPLQIKAALHACQDAGKDRGAELPVMVSVTIELSGSMLIGTDAATIVTIMEPFDILSLGFNCGTGPDQVKKHLKTLSELCNIPISVHANAGLPQNRGGYTYYPMGPDEFTQKQLEFTEFDGVSFLGGCCGTTPQHIQALKKAVETIIPKKSTGTIEPSIASLFNTTELFQKPAPLLIGERSNATGSKAFRELIIASDYEGTLTVGQAQVRDGAHCLDVNVEFAGRDGAADMKEVMELYNQKIPLPLMPDATRVNTMEAALKCIGGKPIINSVNLEDGEEKLDDICRLAKKFGAALVCLTIDEKGMAKTTEEKLRIAERIYDLCVNRHGIDPRNLIFDMLTFTVGSGDLEYRDAAIQTLEAIRQLHKRHPEVGSTLGLSNISFGLDKNARVYLNSVFLHHCIQAGMTSVIINVKHIIPLAKMSREDIDICEELLFNPDDNSLFKFIEHFSDKTVDDSGTDEEYEAMNSEEKIAKLLLDGDKERMIPLVEEARKEIDPDRIVNEILIDAMKVVGELFGSGQMQLPFVLQSAETMKATVDYLNPYLTKQEKETDTTLVIGTVKGDVHDVGKNLVDIILSNNGFKVINVGIKTELDTYLEAHKEHKVQAIGMSGLLVKSTAVMKDNLETMAEMGMTIPILLGGAALTRSFVDDFCRPIYKGPIFYCRDAFDGVIAMSRIEKYNEDPSVGLDTRLPADMVKREKKKEKKEVVIPPFEEIQMPEPVDIPTPPFWGRRVLQKKDLDLSMVFDWVNKKSVIKMHWGYKSKGMTKEAYQKLLDETVYPAYERLKHEFIDKDLFDPTIIYGYYPVRSNDRELLVFSENEGWNVDENADREPFKEVVGRAEYVFSFPRQRRKPYRALSDFFRHERHDVLGITCVSAGSKFSAYEKELYDAGKYLEYNMVHGFSVELAEALAEVAHKQIRMDLGILKEDEGATLRDVRMNRYRGARYSFGYAACPDLEQSRIIFDLLKPEEFGIELSETFQIHPEQSTTALVVHHPKASYYAV
ncbi:5-methyltetrahydrofolate--homocysteine methyltransferase [Sulfurovum lithotrophicum]|uniref:Methionine synthase n=1 Tax=Sulfurovum lithotrophicum TaxID=206403 RepID=A0A7U4M099_9BACT|nr:methionine synthase [Sulfurovum lithotrophicum]AKF24470.1 5-methyltetrahydrofolate--homocysteine methyltransferase [Sulfurovum lithotrophicum]